MCSCHCSKQSKDCVQCAMMVIIAERFHLFPFRTQKLSSHTLTIFGWRRPEKIGRCHQPDELVWYEFFFCLQPNYRDPTKHLFWRGRGAIEIKSVYYERNRVISKSENCDEETARENRTLPSTWWTRLIRVLFFVSSHIYA